MAGVERQEWSLQALGISPYRGNAYDLRIDLNYRNLQHLPPDLFSLGELQWLNLNVNKLRDLPADMTRLSHLKWLYLENNAFQSCPEVVCRLTELVRLYFSCNLLSSLPNAIGRLTHLRWIDLSDNRFAEFPTVLCCGSLAENLERLFLDNNQITSLPGQIANMKSLKLLWLNDNRLEWLPHALCELTGLEELQVRNNPLRCLPVFLAGKLSNLKVFEWQGCPLIQQLTEACQKGVSGLGDHQDQVNKRAEKRGMVHFRAEAGLDGGRERPCYRMRTRPRGVAIVIDNFCTLEVGESLNGRTSSQSSESDGRENAKGEDSTDRLRSVLIKLGFNVRVMRGLMSLDIISALRFLSLEDHSYFDCVIVCILSRGARGGKIIGPDGIAVDVQQLTDIFTRDNCPTLADKPKLFFLQVLESDAKGKQLSPRESDAGKELPTATLIPDDYDFLLTFALIPKAAKSDSLDSVYHFYVGVLFDMLEKFARKLNLLDVMTTVHGEVKKRRLLSENSPEERVQISPEIQTTLRYNLYLSMGSPAAGQGSRISKSVPSSRAATLLR
ncbi:putative disease resistance protein RGA4 [Acanthaster planci]|uniref:Disease resistance protein RGA4 n=1 Tax=Acanthaster planci TaxID=133434 RepID=A0A8B7XJQ4_ACAPL|nr:putative disease resistance protein RGA4 [Acanthaster planci]